jgi:hypothetical protein
MLLVSEIFFQYMKRIKEVKEKEIHLFRDSKGLVQFPKGKEWHDSLSEKGVASMFCPVPASRRQRLLRQIVMLKSFWDISSYHRATRLSLILANNWLE